MISKIKTKTKVTPLTSWVILDDPRTIKEEQSKIFLDDNTKRMLDAEEIENQTTQTVVCCGPTVKSRDEMPPGSQVIIDPRVPGELVEVNRETGECVAYVQESQILMVVK